MPFLPVVRNSPPEAQPSRPAHRAQRATMKRGSPIRVLLQNFVFCTAIALLLWLFVPSVGQYGFFSNFVHAQAIGTSITVLAITLTRWATAAGLNEMLTNVLSIGVATVLGVIIGLWLAAVLLGLDTHPLTFLLDANELLISAITAVLASLAFNWYLHRREKLMRLELLASEERRRADAANHAMLRAQLEPHMLFNTLANLRALIGHDTDQAISMLDRLDSFLRGTLKSSKATWHLLADEFTVLEDYLALMKIRMADRLSYSLDLPPACQTIEVPTLILQPLVENAIRHGIEPKIGGGQITIEATLEKGMLSMIVADTGVGATPDVADQSSPGTDGFGLENIRQRLQQAYGDEATLQINYAQHPETGTRAIVTLPVESIQ